MRLRLTLLLLLCFALPAYATDTLTVQVDRDNGTTQITDSVPFTPAAIGAATAAQGATVDKVAGTVYLLADYASLQAAVDAASTAGGGTVLNAKGATINITATFRPKNNVKVDFNGGKLAWTGAAGGVMVENDITTYGTKFFQMTNGDIDPGSNVATVFKLHSIRSCSIGNMHLVSGNNSLEFMHLYADAQVNDPEDGVRSSNDNSFGPFWADRIVGSGVPVVDKVLALEGATGGNWYGVTRNHFIGPWVFYYRTTGYDFKQYCDSNIFIGMHALTSTTNDGNGICAIFNNSATPSTDVDVWGEYFTGALSCETWYTGTPGKKGVVINKAGAINIANLTNDRTSPDYWGSNLIVDNYSMGHVINEVRGTPDNKVISHTKGNVLVEGTGNGISFPDTTKQTTAGIPLSYLSTATLGSPGSDTKVPTEKVVRDAIAASSSGLSDPGGNGIVKRTSLNTSGVAGYGDVVALFGSGSCSGFLKNDGTCATSAGGTVSAVTSSDGSLVVTSPTTTPDIKIDTTKRIASAGQDISGVDWIAGTGTVSTVASTSTLGANTTGSFSVLKPGSSIKLSSGTVVDVLSATDTSNVLMTTNPSAITNLTWSYRNPAMTIQSAGVDYGYLKNTGLNIKGDGVNTTASFDLHNWNNSSPFRGSRANGTPSSPTSVTTNNVLTALTGQGWVSSAGSGVWANAGAIQLKAGESWTGTTTGSYWSMVTVSNGTTTASEKLRLYGDGGLQVGGTFGTSPGAGNVAAITFTPTIPAAATYGATTTIDLAAGDSPSVTLTGNPTLAFSNPKAGQWHRLNLIQGATGGPYTVTWPSTGLVCTWRNTAGHTAPSLLAGAGAVDTIIIHTLSTTSAECWTAGNK